MRGVGQAPRRSAPASLTFKIASCWLAMAHDPPPYVPLRRWSRPLTAEERASERAYQREAHDTSDASRRREAFRVPLVKTREDHFPGSSGVGAWYPLLPSDVVDSCPWCTLPLSRPVDVGAGGKLTPLRRLRFDPL